MKMRIVIAAVTAVMMGLLTGCGNTGNDETVKLEGSCMEILNQVYAEANLDADLKTAMENYDTNDMTDELEEYLLGTTEVDYEDAAYSIPLINAIAYQCVVLRVEDGDDVQEVKQQLSDNADPRKWVCVEPESILVENVGDVILFVMADEQTAEALQASFLALGK